MHSNNNVFELKTDALRDKTILLTGGTGSFGKQFIRIVLEHCSPKQIIIYSRDELKQFEMDHGEFLHCRDKLHYVIGDVRDKDRMSVAMRGVDYVVHAAALKQVVASERNPFEAVKTNVIGAQNIIECAMDQGVKRVVALSTDKAANPINLYGATKLASDKLFIAANAHFQSKGTKFAVVRYGNVVGSRGSVIPFFKEKAKEGLIPITDPRMTRFWITLDQGVRFVLNCLDTMIGGELFVPKIPSMNIMDLAEAVAPGVKTKNVGIRPGEKVHEVMVPEDDARNTFEFPGYFAIMPGYLDSSRLSEMGGRPVAEEFRYASDNNPQTLTIEELREIAEL